MQAAGGSGSGTQRSLTKYEGITCVDAFRLVPKGSLLERSCGRRNRFSAGGTIEFEKRSRGLCGHICNASYAVSSDARGRHIGEQLVPDCLKKGKEPGFRMKDGHYESICPYYHEL